MIILNEERLNIIKGKINDIKEVKSKYIDCINNKKNNIKKDIPTIENNLFNKAEELEKYYKSIGVDFTTYNSYNSIINYYDKLNNVITNYNGHNNYIYVYDLNNINDIYCLFKDPKNVKYISDLLLRYLVNEHKITWFKINLKDYLNDIQFIDENILISTMDLVDIL